MKLLIIIILILIQNFGKAQTFQKIYMFEDSFAYINDVFVTDSCYYFQGVSGFGSQRCDVKFGKLSLNGDVVFTTTDITPNEYNLSYGGLCQLDTNHHGNFIISYTNRIFNESYSKPNITEINKTGNTIESHNFFLTDSLDFYDFGRTIVVNDSTYISAFNYLNNAHNDPISSYNESGVLLFNTNSNFDTLWTKRLHAPGNNQYKPQWTIHEIKYLEENQYLVMINEYQNASIPNLVSRIRLFLLNSNGDILNQEIFQETDFTYSGFSLLPLSDGNTIIQYYDSRLVDESGNISREYRACIARMDNNFQLVWKDTLDENFYPNLALTKAPMKFVQVNDSVFAGSNTNIFSVMYDSSQWNTLRLFERVRIFNKTLDGETLWNRDYVYWQPLDSINDPYYVLWDFEKTPDGGFITCGNAFNTDYIMAGEKGQFGYVLKTNCLGFLGDPIAEYSYTTTNDLQVNIVNTSIQSGGCIWDFGDGTQLQTGENIDSIQHTYLSPGTYNLTLIALGCNGMNDTISTFITVQENNNDTCVYVGDGTLLTIYPNPTMQGEDIGIYVGNISDENTFFEMMDYNGKIVFSEPIPVGNTNYLIAIKLAAGTYMATIRSNKKVLEMERLLIH